MLASGDAPDGPAPQLTWRERIVGHVGATVYDRDMDAAQPTAPNLCVPVRGSKRLPCDACGAPMEPEHAHYRCPQCGYILPCCGW
jgi:hypothetical protein